MSSSHISFLSLIYLSTNQNIQMIHSLLIRIEWTTGNGIFMSSSHRPIYNKFPPDPPPVSCSLPLSPPVPSGSGDQSRGPAWELGATNQIVSTHFYPGFVSWLVKLAPVAQISWHPHPSHHRLIQQLSIRIQVTSSPLHVHHLYTHIYSNCWYLTDTIFYD